MKITLRMMLPLFGIGIAFAAAPAEARNYDCSKAGNANKAACKAAAPAAAAPAAKASAARNYDCTKAGNANKTACKGAAVAAAPAPAPVAKSMPAPTHVTTASKPVAAKGPSGATAQCKDGTYSQSKTHSGTCSHHGGVATWY